MRRDGLRGARSTVFGYGNTASRMCKDVQVSRQQLAPTSVWRPEGFSREMPVAVLGVLTKQKRKNVPDFFHAPVTTNAQGQHGELAKVPQ